MLLDGLLTTAARGTFIGIAVWAVVLLAALVAEAASQGRFTPARFVAPDVVRRALLPACVTLLGVLSSATWAAAAVPSVASGRSVPASRSSGGDLHSRLEGLRSPDRVVGATRRVHRVVAGESLWSITARILVGSSTTPPPPDRVAREVARLYRTNAAAIGSDPDLIQPGTRLVMPTTWSTP